MWQVESMLGVTDRITDVCDGSDRCCVGLVGSLLNVTSWSNDVWQVASLWGVAGCIIVNCA